MIKETQIITTSLKENIQVLDKVLLTSENQDIVYRRFETLGQNAVLVYVDGMASSERMEEHIVKPCLHAKNHTGTVESALVHTVLENSDIEKENKVDKVVTAIFDGMAALLVEGMDTALLFDVRGFVKRSVTKPETEKNIFGPHQGFTESLRDNITLVRRLLHTPLLISKMTTVGDKIPAKLCILSLKGITGKDALARLESRLSSCHVDYVSSAGMLEQLVEDAPFSLFPQCVLTERPDRVASFLLEGQVAVVMEGSPQVLVMPAGLWHLFHAPEDTALRWQYGTFLRLIRLLGVLVTLYLPAVFLSVTTFHPEVLPLSLLTAVTENQGSVPLSLFAQGVLLLLAFDLINEAGSRVPGMMGSVWGIVSGLVLGQASVEAKLISPLLLIVIALSGLGSYAVPDYSLSLALRIQQIVFLLFAGVMGFYGVLLFTLLLSVGVLNLRSLRVPLFAPASPLRPANPDLLLRLPVWRQRLRAYLADPDEMLRSTGRMRGWKEDK